MLKMGTYEAEQAVCDIGGIKIGGQPGEHAPLLIGNMFQKGDTILQSRKEKKFDEKEAESRIREMERLSEATGVPGLVAMVANSPDEMKVYVDFVTGVTDAPFAIDIWKEKTRVAAARYAAEQGLQDRLLYNSIGPWDEDIEGQVAELKDLGIKHVVMQVFDMGDKGPEGRITSLERMLPMVEKGEFDSILVDTSVMSLPFTAFSLKANHLIKEKYGLPVGCAPSNGTYMYRKAVGEEGRSTFPPVDAAIQAITALESDFLFCGPMSGTSRVFAAVAAAVSLQAALSYADRKALPAENHPINRLFPEAVEQLRAEKGDN
jgi:tetrahydromethanopterin S-methyltransferase subunit H